MNQRAVIIWVLVLAGARVLLQIGAMPPYAGLDEVYHVGRTHFVLDLWRNPTSVEPSFPTFLAESVEGRAGALPDFAHRFSVWPDLLRQGYSLPEPSPALPLPAHYATPNYEAQQPSAYYWIGSIAVRLSGVETATGQLRVLRLLSGAFAVLTVLFAALIGRRELGQHGLLAAALIPLLPTWETLLVRASNDAMACAALAAAIFLSMRASDGTRGAVFEGIAWGVALAVKLFTWPVAIVLLFLHWRRRADPRRTAIVLALSGLAVIATVGDLHRRTGNLTGLFAFDAPSEAQPAALVPIAYGEMAKIIIASGIWMSGQHNNALTPLGMGLFTFPLVLGAVVWLFTARSSPEERTRFSLIMVAVFTFAAAQAVNAWPFIQKARLAGESLPLGGKEGWYWYVLAPLLVPLVFGVVFQRLRFAGALILFWLFVWDVVIAEGALFRDYAGLTSPASRAPLFRWGPAPILGSDLYVAIERFAIGPFQDKLLLLRAMATLACGALLVSATRLTNERREAPMVDRTPNGRTLK